MKKILGLICSMLMAFYASAQETILLVEKNQPIGINALCYFFEDKQSVFSMEKVGEKNWEAQFSKTLRSIPNFGIVSYPIWCKFTVKNLTGEPCFLFIKSATIDSLTLYISQDSSSRFTTKNSGYYLPLHQRDLPTASAYAFALSPSSQPFTYYLKITSTNSIYLPLKIGTKDAIWKEVSQFQSIDALFFGIITFAILYNLFLYFSLREICYLYYVFFGIGLILNAVYHWGYFLLLSEKLNIGFYHYPYTSIGVLAVSATLFTMSFLHTAKYTPRMHLAFKGFTFFFIAYWFFDIFKILPLQTLLIIFSIVVLLIFPLYFYGAVQVYRQGFKPALFYLLAWGIFLLTAVWMILSNLGIFPAAFFINYQLQIGAALEMLLLSFALAHRIKILEKEKIKTQSVLLHSLHVNEQKLKQQQSNLEEQIQEKNLDLQNRQEEILRQNEELLAQQEEMQRQKSVIEQQNQELFLQNRRMKANEAVLQKAYFKLTQAQKTIQEQHEQLKKYNENLEAQIQERTQQIAKANAELIKQNNQLEQFAFITAHNLRSPVARILGLANILDTKNLNNSDNQFVLEKIIVVAHELETVIKDLNIILDIKKGINQIIEVIKFSEKLEKVKGLLENQIYDNKVQLEADFSQINTIQSVSPYVESILYNLISNAIKYRNPQKVPHIKIKTEIQTDYVVLSVADNGLGIDLEANKGKIFTLYRRFHDHVEGKGMGLYLIKTQMETLGGKVEITSKLGEGTTFYVFFPKRPS